MLFVLTDLCLHPSPSRRSKLGLSTTVSLSDKHEDGTDPRLTVCSCFDCLFFHRRLAEKQKWNHCKWLWRRWLISAFSLSLTLVLNFLWQLQSPNSDLSPPGTLIPVCCRQKNTPQLTLRNKSNPSPPYKTIKATKWVWGCIYLCSLHLH